MVGWLVEGIQPIQAHLGNIMFTQFMTSVPIIKVTFVIALYSLVLHMTIVITDFCFDFRVFAMGSFFSSCLHAGRLCKLEPIEPHSKVLLCLYSKTGF